MIEGVYERVSMVWYYTVLESRVHGRLQPLTFLIQGGKCLREYEEEGVIVGVYERVSMVVGCVSVVNSIWETSTSCHLLYTKRRVLEMCWCRTDTDSSWLFAATSAITLARQKQRQKWVRYGDIVNEISRIGIVDKGCRR